MLSPGEAYFSAGGCHFPDSAFAQRLFCKKRYHAIQQQTTHRAVIYSVRDEDLRDTILAYDSTVRTMRSWLAVTMNYACSCATSIKWRELSTPCDYISKWNLNVPGECRLWTDRKIWSGEPSPHNSSISNDDRLVFWLLPSLTCECTLNCFYSSLLIVTCEKTKLQLAGDIKQPIATGNAMKWFYPTPELDNCFVFPAEKWSWQHAKYLGDCLRHRILSQQKCLPKATDLSGFLAKEAT